MRTACGEEVAFAGGTGVSSPAPVPLVVDLDDTLVRSDLLIESVLWLLRREPGFLFLLPIWLLRGMAAFKHEVARRVTPPLDVRQLPWRGEFIDKLKRQRAEGRSLVLATGSDERIARAVAAHLKIFDLVLASDGRTNLCGDVKRRRLVERFGERGFDYAASGERADRAVWRSARQTIDVQPERRARKEGWRALRIGQWMKNLLVFVPLVAAHRFYEWGVAARSVASFVAFGCCASAGYLLNDLIDLEADRHHPQKRFRPLAAGSVPLAWALGTIPALLAIGCAIGAAVSPLLAIILLTYFGCTTAYSLHIKKVAVLDVLFLAGLYTLRIEAGSAATGIWSSHWLLAFSSFLFLSLALAKRYGELVSLRRVDGDGAHARGYEIDDEELLAAMGISSGFLAVLVLALYMTSNKAASLYAHPGLLWILLPMLLYWISYIWLTAHRGKMEHDPIAFAAEDRTSRILLALMAGAAAVALAA